MANKLIYFMTGALIALLVVGLHEGMQGLVILSATGSTLGGIWIALDIGANHG